MHNLIPRVWYDKLKSTLISRGFTNTMFDSSLFVPVERKVTVHMLIYADDILITRPEDYIQNLIKDLNSQFSLKDLGKLNFLLGIEAHRSNGGLHLYQAKHAEELLIKTRMQDTRPCKSPVATCTKLFMGDSEAYGDPKLYRSTIGALQYLTLTRLDLSYVVNKLSQFLKEPSELQW